MENSRLIIEVAQTTQGELSMEVWATTHIHGDNGVTRTLLLSQSLPMPEYDKLPPGELDPRD